MGKRPGNKLSPHPYVSSKRANKDDHKKATAYDEK